MDPEGTVRTNGSDVKAASRLAPYGGAGPEKVTRAFVAYGSTLKTFEEDLNHRFGLTERFGGEVVGQAAFAVDGQGNLYALVTYRAPKEADS